MEDSKTSLFDLSGLLREYCSILVNAMDRIDSEPIEMPMAHKIFTDLLDIGQRTHGLFDGPQLLQQLEISTREILELSIPQRNDLYSLIFERLSELYTIIAENPKFENNSQTIQTSRGEHNLSDSIHDFRKKIGNFYELIFEPSFQPFITGITIEQSEQKQKLEKLLSRSGDIEDEPAPQTKLNTGFDMASQSIAWMYKLGVIDAILNITKDGETPSYRKAGRVISTFTNIDPETARKHIEAIKKPGHSEKNPNPLDNRKTLMLIDQLANEYKIKLME